MSIRTAEWRFFYPPGDDVFLFGCRIIDWIATDSPCNDKVGKGIHLGPVVQPRDDMIGCGGKHNGYRPAPV